MRLVRAPTPTGLHRKAQAPPWEDVRRDISSTPTGLHRDEVGLCSWLDVTPTGRDHRTYAHVEPRWGSPVVDAMHPRVRCATLGCAM